MLRTVSTAETLARRQAAVAVGAFAVLATLYPPRCAAAQEPIEWNGAVAWQEFEPAMARAAQQNKAVMVVVYADWCPKCRTLAPLFRSGPLVAASAQVIAVLANHDQRPEWLESKLGDTANYVPRVYFLRPDGQVLRDITSDNAKFPHFFHPNKPQDLTAAIARAVASVSAASSAQTVLTPVASPPPPPGKAGAVSRAVASPPDAAPPYGQASGDLDRDLVAGTLLVVLLGGATWWILRSKPMAESAANRPPDP